MKTIWKIALPTGVLILGLAGYTVAGGTLLMAPVPVVPPQTVAVRPGGIEETVLAQGVIEAQSLVTVGAEVSGTIKAVHTALGQHVDAGASLAEIDSMAQANAVETAEAALQNIRAQRELQVLTLAQARRDFQRTETLHSDDLATEAAYQASRLTVQTAEAQLDALSAQVRQAELAVTSANLALQKTTIVAPASGTVVSLPIEVGQSLNASNANPVVAKIADLDTMVVRADISEADVARVHSGQLVRFTVLGDPDNSQLATLSATEPAPASISTASAADTTTPTAVYYVGVFEVANPDHILRIGMTVQVTIVIDSVDDALLVPASVLTSPTDGGGYKVAVWNATTGTTEAREVVVGLNDKMNAEVLSGLREGDQVVLAGDRQGATNDQRPNENKAAPGSFLGAPDGELK